MFMDCHQYVFFFFSHFRRGWSLFLRCPESRWRGLLLCCQQRLHPTTSDVTHSNAHCGRYVKLTHPFNFWFCFCSWVIKNMDIWCKLLLDFKDICKQLNHIVIFKLESWFPNGVSAQKLKYKKKKYLFVYICCYVFCLCPFHLYFKYPFHDMTVIV